MCSVRSPSECTYKLSGEFTKLFRTPFTEHLQVTDSINTTLRAKTCTKSTIKTVRKKCETYSKLMENRQERR